MAAAAAVIGKEAAMATATAATAMAATATAAACLAAWKAGMAARWAAATMPSHMTRRDLGR